VELVTVTEDEYELIAPPLCFAVQLLNVELVIVRLPDFIRIAPP
jgi:hypothetical protein